MFRIWANRILKEYIIKGYVMDDERLKEPENFFGKDYLKNSWSASVTFAPAREDFTRKSRTYIPNAAPTMTWTAL